MAKAPKVCLNDIKLKLLTDQLKQNKAENDKLTEKVKEYESQGDKMELVYKMTEDVKQQKKKAEQQSLNLANAVRKMREKLHNQKIEIEKQTEELTRANKDNKRLRDLLKDDHSAIKRYLGIVLGKNSTDLAPEEKMQVRTLLKDSTDDQASNTMAAWDTILNLKT